MYQFQLTGRSDAAGLQVRASAKVPAIVYGIGLSSLLADVSSEMVSSVLPVFLFGFL